jgi:predicted nucleic acid-binding Zn ribbon protein
MPKKLVKHKNCIYCGKLVPEGRFTKCSDNCPEQMKAQIKLQVQNARLRARNKKLILVNMKGGCCCRCGYSKCLRALVFHHRDPLTKEFNISASRMQRSWDRILDEVEKTDLYCYNCHNVIHDQLEGNANSSKIGKKIKLSLVEAKGGCCEKCGYKECMRSLSFHHIDPTKKTLYLNSNLNKSTPKDLIEKEMENTQLLCMNCHYEEHYMLENPSTIEELEEFDKTRITRGSDPYIFDLVCATCGSNFQDRHENMKFCSRKCLQLKFMMPLPPGSSWDLILSEIKENGCNQVARKYDIDKQIVKKWLDRYEKEGLIPPVSEKPLPKFSERVPKLRILNRISVKEFLARCEKTSYTKLGKEWKADRHDIARVHKYYRDHPDQIAAGDQNL